MGIYDREYVFREKRTGPMGLSVSAWIIIANCLVFLFTATPILNGLGRPALRGFNVTQPAQGTVREEKEYRVLTPMGVGEKAGTRYLSRYGNLAARRLVDSDGRVVGEALYQVNPALYSWGYFSTYMGFLRWEVWRLVTFQFLHAGFMHIFFNMFGIWIFGRMVEEHLGPKRYLAFYLVCGICGGLMYLILNGLGYLAQIMNWPMIPGLLFNDPATPLVGASAGVFGVIMASAYLAPNSVVQLLFPPIPLRLRTFAYVYVGIAAASVILGARNAGGEAAHVGGAIAGYFFIRNSHLLRDFFDVFGDSRRKSKREAAGATARSGRPIFRASEMERLARDQAEADRILEKVQREGVQSLTESEKATLQRVTDAMNRER